MKNGLATGIVLCVLTLPAAGLAEELTTDQKVDKLWKKSELVNVGVNALQLQYASDASTRLSQDTAQTSPKQLPGGTGSSGTFVRRAELYAKGKVVSGLTYEFVYDLSASTDPVRDAFVDLKYIPMVDVRVGQFRIPFGIENQTSSKKLLFVDRMLWTSPDNEQASSKVVTSLGSGLLQERDLGMRLSGKPLDGPVAIEYQIAGINGSDKNTADKNNIKDLVGRVALSAMGKATLGGSLYLGRTFVTDATVFSNPPTNTQNATATGDDLKKYRTGADLEIRPTDVLLVRAEYIAGADGVAVTHQDKKFKGYYALVAYRLPFNLEPAVRFERLDPDTRTAHNAINRTTLGMNYYFAGDTKFQLNYEFRDDKGNKNVGNMAIAQMQVSF